MDAMRCVSQRVALILSLAMAISAVTDNPVICADEDALGSSPCSTHGPTGAEQGEESHRCVACPCCTPTVLHSSAGVLMPHRPEVTVAPAGRGFLFITVAHPPLRTVKGRGAQAPPTPPPNAA
jgi:hypothetical protein